MGAPPPYISEDDPIYLPTANKVTAIKRALLEERKNAIIFIQDYYNSFLNALPDFSIDESELNRDNYDAVVLKKISDLFILRNDFIEFMNTYTSYSLDIDLDRLHRFFEKLLSFLTSQDGFGGDQRSFSSIKIDGFRFFYYELFLYFTSLMIEKERFEELGYILHTPFLIDQRLHNEPKVDNYISFRNYVATLNMFRNEKLNLNRVSVTADLIKERTDKRFKFGQLQQADALLYYLSILFPSQNRFSRRVWFPETTCYDIYHLPLMNKAISKRFFEKLLPLFNVKNKEELDAKVEEVLSKNADNLERFRYEVPGIKYGLNIEKLATLP